ncbi:MAG: M28 family peptidase, partial [Lentisphaeria bacterium]|nr:M28 family peptidase [Lentisphaeria bacterium]
MKGLTALISILTLAAACSPPASPVLPSVDPELAWKYAEKSVAFGPRHSGSKAISDHADWIVRTASECRKFKVTEQRFEQQTPGGRIQFRNIIAEIPGKSREWILIGAHYDIKKFLSIPEFQGANDGASGVAALLAMIHALEKYPEKPPYT